MSYISYLSTGSASLREPHLQAINKTIMQKGTCLRNKKFFGIITLTEKGQLAIPVELRRILDLKKGDKLAVIKRKDNQGVNLVKADAFENIIEKMSVN